VAALLATFLLAAGSIAPAASTGAGLAVLVTPAQRRSPRRAARLSSAHGGVAARRLHRF
jgi:hypothetical protein